MMHRFAPWIVALQDRRRLLVGGVLAVQMILALAVRVYVIEAPGVAPEREYRSALLARSFYMAGAADVPAWRREVAQTVRSRERFFEPPVIEWMAAGLYHLVRGEDLRIGRVLSACFWLFGGVFLFLIVERLVSTRAGLVASAYYLFVPAGIVAGRSFQPDSLMILLFLAGLYTLLRYADQPTRPALVTAALIAALTLLIRPLVLFALVGAFGALALYRSRSGRIWRDPNVWLYVIISLLPFIAFYVLNGLWGESFLMEHVETKIRPQLLGRLTFWFGWLTTASFTVGKAPLLLAIAGAPLLGKGPPRWFLAGLVAGYVVFCLVFSYHSHWIGYYHLQLIPLVALAASPLAELLFRHLGRAVTRWYGWVPAALVVLIALGFSLLQARDDLASKKREPAPVAQEIGRLVDHSRRVVYVGYAYGVSLMYYSETAGTYWPRASSDLSSSGASNVAERMAQLGFEPEYVVITHFVAYRRYHQDLSAFLEQHGVLVADHPAYRIYRLS